MRQVASTNVIPALEAIAFDQRDFLKVKKAIDRAIVDSEADGWESLLWNIETKSREQFCDAIEATIKAIRGRGCENEASTDGSTGLSQPRSRDVLVDSEGVGRTSGWRSASQ